MIKTLFFSIFLFFSITSHALEVNTKIGVSGLLFQHDPLYNKQHKNQFSLYGDIEFYHDWNNAKDSLTFKPYARLDQHDSNRTHADIRELLWLHVGEDWELRTGITKIFWGVNEGNHLVDIINQNDQVDDLTGESKLGQPMINLSLLKEWGTIDLFVLPYFRERQFPGLEGRLRSSLLIDKKQSLYESSRKEKHIDFAIRWSHSIDDYDIGLHLFKGTNRTPKYQLQTIPSPVLIPYYDQITQFGLDFQATLDGWLYKLEVINRKDQIDHFTAISGGFEYTINGILDSDTDLGLIMEYSWDERNQPHLSQFQNDVMIGTRLALNDAQSSELLAGLVQNLDHQGLRSFQIEASRRLGENYKLNLELRLFADHSFNPISHDDHLQISLEYFF